MNTFIVLVLCLLAVPMQGCQALPINANSGAHISSAAFGLAFGLGFGLGIPLAVLRGILIHRLVRHIRFRRQRQEWRRKMAISIRAQQDKEEAETCLPGFGGGLGITWPPVCHIKDSSPPATPATSLPTIFEEDESF